MKIILDRRLVEEMAAKAAEQPDALEAMVDRYEAYLDFNDPDVERQLRLAARELGRIYHCGYEHADLGDGWLGIRLRAGSNAISRRIEQYAVQELIKGGL